MPRKSKRHALLTGLREVWQKRLALSDAENSSDEDDDISFVLLYFALASKRYISPPRTRIERPPHRMEFHLTRMNETEFKLKLHMNRSYFLAVCQLIADDSEFKSVTGKQQRQSVELHVMALLRTLGSLDGQGHSADFLSVGSHTPETLFARRVVRALLMFKMTAICWPSEKERHEISARVKAVSGFPHCVGLIDGTFFPCATARKIAGKTSIRCRIRYENIGWPGSSYDNRVWGNSKLAIQQDEFFEQNEFILGDSADQPSSVLIPAYKSSRGGELALKEAFFNTRLAKIRICVEHRIGRLKGRFPLLSSLRCRLQNKTEMEYTISLSRAAMILHNMAIDDPIPEEWMRRDPEDDSDEDDSALPGRAEINEERRSYLRDYLFDSSF